MGGRGAKIASAGGSAGGSVEVTTQQKRWLDNVVPQQMARLRANIQSANNERSQRFHENELESFVSTSAKSLGVSEERFEQLADGRLTARVKEERKTPVNVPASPKTFVNSFGEATKRSITSPSYDRAQKRIDKAVLRNLGNR